MPKKKIEYCENHPDVAAIGECSECGKKICYNCALKWLSRNFCGALCVFEYFFKNAGKIIFIFLSFLVRGINSLIIRFFSGGPKGLLSVLLSAGLAAALFWIWHLSSQLSVLKDSQDNFFDPPFEIAADFSDASFSIKPSEGGMITSNTVSITGEADNNRIISLSADNKILKVLIPENGKFNFDNIQLGRGDNELTIRAISQEGMVEQLQKLVFYYAPPTVSHLAKNFSRGFPGSRKMAFTFDGGAENNSADDILNILRDKDISSTFFLTGAFMRRFPDTVRRIVEDGHEVGNHTWSHPHLTTYEQNRRHDTLDGVDYNKIKEELSQTARLFKEITGKDMAALWRAPYGEFNQDILQWAAQCGYRHVGWTTGRGWENNMDTMDWVADTTASNYYSAEAIAEKVINFGSGKTNGAGGAVILMHLGTNRQNDFPHLKLGKMIEGLKSKGYTLTTVSEMIDGS